MTATSSGRITRRLLITGGATIGVVAATGAGVLGDVLPGGSWLRRNLGFTGTDGTVPDVVPGPVQYGTLASAARGRDVDVCTMLPPGTTASAGLPVCLALHGRGSSVRDMVTVLGLPQILAATVRAGSPPFALVAVHGGDSYWHQVQRGDDPLRMLLDELPGWLGQRGFTAVPRAVVGHSMGGFGALLYARTRAERGAPTPACAVVSPALFADWSEAQARAAFADRADWEATEPLRHLDRLDGKQLGVWCGSADVFLDNARALATGTHAAVGEFEPGGHTTGYALRALPAALRFVGQHLG